jgi:hypothetical protein
MLEKLLGQQIELFDESGGCLDGRGKYVQKWWELSPFRFEQLQNRYFLIRDNQKRLYRHKIKNILDIKGNCITLISH